MENEQNKTLQVLQFAIQMEIDGKQFYLKASRASTNDLGKKLLQTLADEEDIHRRKFEEIYDSIRVKKEWPKTGFQPDGGKKLRTVFAQAIEETNAVAPYLEAELDAVKMAMEMEHKSKDYYQKQSETATYDIERDFYQNLVTEEREHHLVLLDYFEYLKDPAAWFVHKEHPSLDGG
jgi:rubrerythrin